MTSITQPSGEARVRRAKRVPLSADEPTTLVEMLEYAVRSHNRPDAINYKQNGKWLSISSDELLRRIHHIAAAIHSLGVSRGDRVAILS